MTFCKSVQARLPIYVLLLSGNNCLLYSSIGISFNPLPSGTRATFFLTAVGQIKHTEEGDISREKDDPDDVTAAREGRRR
jgi:hypothetical protein